MGRAREVARIDRTVPDEVFNNAHAFVHDHGSPLMRALADHALGRADAGLPLNKLLVFQNPDGGWRGLDSDMKGALSTISQTWVGLKWLHWLRSPDSSAVDRTVDFLMRSQRLDGYWDEPDEILKHEPPRWMIPGDCANRLWLTAATYSRLLLLSREADVRFEAALDFLRGGWEGERFPVYNHTHWVSLVVFGLLDRPTRIDREIFNGCLRFLEDALAEDRVDPFDVTEIARDALHVGPPAAQLVESALPRLLTGQAGDGGWTTGYGDRHRPKGTVEAMYVLKLAAAD